MRVSVKILNVLKGKIRIPHLFRA
uniref:Uncharacterized protein n=1 Tax=Rhizophora mucronata TaxID=61149 RepID=A0A2P2QNG6_RHIMU